MGDQCILLAILCLIHAVASEYILNSTVAVTQLEDDQRKQSNLLLNYDFSMNGTIDLFGFNPIQPFVSQKTDASLNGTFAIRLHNSTIKEYLNFNMDGRLTARNVAKKNATILELDGMVTVHELQPHGPLELHGKVWVNNATDGYTLNGSIYATGAFKKEKTCVWLNGTLHVNIKANSDRIVIINGTLNHEVRASIKLLVTATCGVLGALVACHLVVVALKHGSLGGLRARASGTSAAPPRSALAFERAGGGGVAPLSYAAKAEAVAFS